VARAQTAAAVSAVVLDQVEDLRGRFLEGKAWRASGPPAGAGGASVLAAVPRAVEVTLTLKDAGEVRLLFGASNEAPK
jgi:hypothetical protein